MSAPPRPRRLGYVGPAAQPLLRETLQLVADGCTNRVIANRLGLNENTVKSRLRALFRDLGARDRAHAVALGIRAGLLDVPFHHFDCASHRPRACDCGALDVDPDDEDES